MLTSLLRIPFLRPHKEEYGCQTQECCFIMRSFQEKGNGYYRKYKKVEKTEKSIVSKK